MNKKAAISPFVMDLISAILFAIFLLVILVVISVFKGPEEYKIISQQIHSESEFALTNYLRAPVSFDIDNDGKKENMTFAELIVWHVKTKTPAVQTELRTETTRNLAVEKWGMYITHPETGYSAVITAFAGPQTVKESYLVEIPFENNNQVSKIKIELKYYY